MGNSPSVLVTHAAETSDGFLESLSKDDLKVLENPWFVLNPVEFLSRSDLNYEVPGLETPLKKDEGQNTIQEESLVCSLQSPQRLKEKHEDTCKALLADILQQRGEDQGHKEVTTRLQGFARIYEALIRTYERQTRSSKKEEKDSIEKTKFNTISKASVMFGINTMLNLIKCIGGINPVIYQKLISQTSQILADAYPCSIASQDPVYIEALNKISGIFQSVLRGEIPNASIENQMESISPLFAIGLSTGDLSALLSISSEFISTQPSSQFSSTLKLLHSHLKTLQSVPSCYSYINWSKFGSNCIVTQNSTVIDHKTNTWANCFSEQEFTSGVHYIEFKPFVINTYFGIGVVDSACASTSVELGSANVYFTYHGNGSVKSKGSVVYDWEGWKEGDRISLELDMNAKTVSFYKNGILEPKPVHEGLPDTVKIVASLYENCKIGVINFSDAPIKVSQKQYQEEKQSFVDYKLLENINEEYLKLTPTQTAFIVIKELARINTPLLNLFKKTVQISIPSKIGVGFHVHENTIKLINEIIEKLFKTLTDTKDNSEIYIDMLVCTLKVLKSHLLACLLIKSFKLPTELQMQSMKLLEDICSKLHNKLAYEECNEILSSCFEVFYSTPQEKLSYLIEILKDMHSGKEVPENIKALQQKILTEMAYPYKLFPALIVRDDNEAAEVTKFFEYLTEKATKDSQALLAAETGETVDTSVIKFLEIAQLVLFAQAASENYQGKWQEILSSYAIKFMNNSEQLFKIVQNTLKDGKISEENFKKIENTILNKSIVCLLNMLVLTKMSLEFLSKVLPVLGNIIACVALIPSQPSKTVGGVSSVTEIYESDHNYSDNLNTTHIVRIPFAKKYTLKFDPACKTEGGCDYLECWLDEAKSNKVARWDGEGFPKEPLVIEAPFLVFTFHSDGSVNYWGWKIEIEALVECEFLQIPWPETVKDACGIIIGSISNKLISGDFETVAEDENIAKLLESPLVMYGIKDEFLGIVKPPEPLDKSLCAISTTPGINDKFRPVLLARTYSEDVNRRVVRSQDLAKNLGDYVEDYGHWGAPRYTDDLFLHQLIEGGPKIQEEWNNVKKKAQIIGPESKIGGSELDQAERAVFAIYVGYFEMSNTIKKLFENPNEIGPTLKHIIKVSCQIRQWAQRYKQKTYDSGNTEITYSAISSIIVKKCCFLLAAEHKMSLNEIGVNKVLKNLTTTIKTYQKTDRPVHKEGSKWKIVGGMIETSKKLKGLVNISKSDNTNSSNDQEELNKVVELVNSFLESEYPIEKVVEIIEKRRSKAIARTLGFLCLANLINFSSKHETWLVRVFSTALKVKGHKEHYWKGLEGTDPFLLSCLQKAFFQVYGLLQKELIKSRARPFTIASYNHYISVLEAMSCPLRGVDAYMILELQFPSTLHTLFSWSKGYLGEEVITKPFLKASCVTEFSLVTGASSENRILLESFEDKPSLFLQFEKGGNSLPVTEFIIVPQETLEGYEDAVGEFLIKDVPHRLFIKRETPKLNGLYLTSFDGLSPILTKYEELLGPEKDLDKKKRENLKLSLSKSAWDLYKLLMYSIAGSWVEYNESKKLLVQELFVRALFTELRWDEASSKPDDKDINISEASNGEAWLAKMTVPKSLQKNAMVEWIRRFTNEMEQFDDLMIKKVISEYVEKVDPAMKGVLNDIDIGYIDKESADTLKQFEDNKNDKGQYDFFRYLAALKSLSSDFPFNVQDYLESSILWTDLPTSFYEAMKDYNFSNIVKILENSSKIINPLENGGFSKFIDAFINSETPGIIEKLSEDDPHEFKNSAGKLDFYLALHAIIKNQEKFSQYYLELEKVFDMYDDLPASCEEIYKDRCGHEDYITSLLWTLLGCFGSKCLGKVLSRPEYFEEILKLTFLSKSEKVITLGYRLLAQIMPSYHSPQTLFYMWNSVNKALPKPEKVDFIKFLLRKIGRGIYSYGLKDRVKIQQRWMYESQNLLLALSHNERWRTEIVKSLITSITEGIELILSGKQLEFYHTGGVFFLSNISKYNDNYDQIPLEMSIANLNDSSLAKGIIKKISGNDVTIYSVIEDTTITEPISKIISIDQYISNNFYELLSQSQNESISSVLLKFWKVIEKNGVFINFQDSIENIRILYSKLEMAVINAYNSIIEHIELTQEQTVEIMVGISNNFLELPYPSKNSYDKVFKKVCENARKESKSEAGKKMTDEEAYQKLGQLNEETQIIASELLSLDIPVTKIIKCFELGIKDLEGVISYVEPVVEDKPVELLYQLSNISSLKSKDLTGTAELYQNTMSHLVISTKSSDGTRKELTGTLDKSIFHNCKETPEMLTFVVAIEGKPDSQGSLTFGFILGDLNLEVNNKAGELVFANTGSPYSYDKVLVLRIFASPSGDVTIHNENSSENFSVPTATVYNGLNIGEFGIYLEQGEKVELLSFDIHIGKYDAKIDKKFDKPKPLEGGERYLKFKTKGKVTERARLKILGLNEEEINETMVSAPDFNSRIEYSLKHFGQRDLLSSNLSLNHEVILDFILVNSELEIPKGYKKVPVYEDGKYVEYQSPALKIPLVKKETYQAGKVLTSISILESAPDHQEIGNLSLVTEGDNPDWSTPIFAKLILPKPGEQTIKDIIFFKTNSINSVLLPHGYKFLIDKEGKVINVGSKKEKAFYLFMAILTDDILMDSYVIPYHTTKLNSDSFGMVNKFDTTEKSKTENLKEYDELSPLELAVTLLEFENSRAELSIKNLFISLAKKSEKTFIKILQEGNIKTILKILKNDLKELSKIFDSIIKNPEVEGIRKKIVVEVLREILSCIVGEETGGSKTLKPITIESAHPYDNNMDVDQVVSIPGASSLRIVFDSQCHTESGCDPLRFYEQSGRVGELRNISGQGETVWTPFDVNGDTVHLYFHSDGSVVYWGYKFDVIPANMSKSVIESPDISLWLLQKIVALDFLSDEFELLTNPRVLQSIFVLSLSSSDLSHKQSCIDIIRKLLRGQKHPIINNIIEMFIKEASLIYIESKKSSHPLLQSLILLIASVKESYDIKLTDEWLINFSELLSDMKGLCDRDDNLNYFLFERFKSKLSKSMSTVYESEHPYKKLTHQTEVKVPHASFISIEFDEQSKIDSNDEIIFSYDAEMKKRCVHTNSNLNSVSGQGWDNTTKGPDIAISNEGLTVTRTNSSGWGSAQWTEAYSTSQVRFNFHIDNDGASDYLYIGVANTSDFPALNICSNSDSGKDVWAWKRNGECHKRGSNVTHQGYKTGDTISILIDMNSKELVFIKDNAEVYKFTGLSDEVRPIICFGGSNQIVTILSIEKSGANAPINKRSLKIPGDLLYASFPVNAGATKSHIWQNPLPVASTDATSTIITKLQPEKSIHTTSEPIQSGKNFIEISINSVGKLAIGLSLVSNIRSKDLDIYHTMLYESTGNIVFNKDDHKSPEYTIGDVIGCYFDFETLTLKFYKNGEIVFEGVTEKLEGNNELGYCAVLYEEKQSVSINQEFKYGLDFDYLRLTDGVVASSWGYKFTATAEFKGRSKKMIDAVLNLTTPELKSEWETEYLPKMTNFFKTGASEQLVMYLDEYVSKVADKNILKLLNEDINPTPEELIFYPELEQLTIDEIRELYQILLLFNTEISKDMHLINLHIDSYENMTELQRVFMGSRNYIFFATKITTFKEVLSRSNSDARPEITVDRPKAMRHRHRKDVDALGQFSIFGQIYRALANKNNTEFRNSERIFRVSYRGEAATDAGGPYNEVISNICDELQSSFLTLLIPTPNNTHNMGENRDCWIVNPAATSKNDKDLFLFVGKLMGVAIRTQNNLNLSLPPLFWKRLLLDPVNIRDLRSIDVCFVQILEILRNPEANKITPEAFSQSYDEKFTAKDTSGKESELKENGKNIPVTYENAKEYSELVEKFRLSENQIAYDMIRKGMSAVIPMDYLNLLSWRQVQTLVCGAPEIDVDILMENTEYESCSKTDPHILLFWEVMREMNAKEKSLYLKFVWGRSRLPAGRDFRHMKITRYHAPGPVNNYLPITHTCFFTIDLPVYTTKEAMRNKLLYAITHCTAIDLDGSASGGWDDTD